MTGAGKTALAATLALEADFPYLKLVAPEHFVGVHEAGKAQEIAKVFDDAYVTHTHTHIHTLCMFMCLYVYFHAVLCNVYKLY